MPHSAVRPGACQGDLPDAGHLVIWPPELVRYHFRGPSRSQASPKSPLGTSIS